MVKIAFSNCFLCKIIFCFSALYTGPGSRATRDLQLIDQRGDNFAASAGAASSGGLETTRIEQTRGKLKDALVEENSIRPTGDILIALQKLSENMAVWMPSAVVFLIIQQCHRDTVTLPVMHIINNHPPLILNVGICTTMIVVLLLFFFPSHAIDILLMQYSLTSLL